MYRCPDVFSRVAILTDDSYRGSILIIVADAEQNMCAMNWLEHSRNNDDNALTLVTNLFIRESLKRGNSHYGNSHHAVRHIHYKHSQYGIVPYRHSHYGNPHGVHNKSVHEESCHNESFNNDKSHNENSYNDCVHRDGLRGAFCTFAFHPLVLNAPHVHIASGDYRPGAAGRQKECDAHGQPAAVCLPASLAQSCKRNMPNQAINIHGPNDLAILHHYEALLLMSLLDQVVIA